MCLFLLDYLMLQREPEPNPYVVMKRTIDSTTDCQYASMECPICYDTFTIDTEIVQLISCGHAYHHDCFIEFLEHKFAGAVGATCPLCREPIKKYS